MDSVVFAVDMSPVAVALFVIGFLVGRLFPPAYGPSAVISAVLGINAGRWLFGGGYDVTVLPSFLLSFLFAGVAVGGYVEATKRTVMLEIKALKAEVLRRECKEGK
jgi:hypothetical protein